MSVGFISHIHLGKKKSLEKILGKGKGLSTSLECNWINALCVASVVDHSDFFFTARGTVDNSWMLLVDVRGDNTCYSSMASRSPVHCFTKLLTKSEFRNQQTPEWHKSL